MKKGLIELVAILDMSGSMAHLTDDTIGGYNSMLKQQQKADSQVLVTTYVFNNNYRVIHDRVPIDQIPLLTEKDYCPSGCTALMDAMGDAIKHIAGIHHYAREEDIPEHTIFFITTDGMENASRRYSSDEIKRMVQHEEEKYGWDFIYLASNIDAVETAGRYGIKREKSIDFVPDGAGIEEAFEVGRFSIDVVANNEDLKINKSWRAHADSDFRNRRKR